MTSITAVAGQVSAALVGGNLVQITYEPGTDTDGSEGNEAYRRLGNITSIGSTDTFNLSGTFVELTTRFAYQFKKRSCIPFPIE